jgi:RHS repeat-associated protein
VETITEGANNYKIEYYPNQQKAATTLTHNNTVIEHKYYAGKAFEWETVNDKKYYYVYAEGQPIAVFIQDGDDSPVPYLILTDHLGSVDLITDRYGNVVDSMSFDAWGNRRNYNDWLLKDNTVHLIDRGFTMHQHLDSFKLINMEGRMYDPVVAQFLSPDPYVQAPDNTQGLNRYSYCMNSPLMYVDPDGEFWYIIIGAAVGGVANLVIKMNQGQVNSFVDGLAAFGIGSVAGAVGAATGGAAFAAAGGAAAGIGGGLAGAAGGAGGVAFSSPILSIGNSLYFGDPMITMKQYGMAIGMGALLGGFTNGIAALVNGRTFWTGDLPKTTTLTNIAPAPTQNPQPASPENKPQPQTQRNPQTQTTQPNQPQLTDNNNYIVNSSTDLNQTIPIGDGIQITQLGLPSAISYFYRLDNSRLKVFKITKSSKMLKCYKYLNKTQLDSIVHYTTKIINQNYDSIYFGGAIDGYYWKFEIALNETQKNVLFDNYYHESFNNLITIINKTLPPKRQYIRMY